MNWHDLIGQTITEISAPIGDAEILIRTAQGGIRAFHWVDCCESVDLMRVDGYVETLIGGVVTVAEDDAGCVPPDWAEKDDEGESVTWTKLTLGTSTASVHFWVRGASNGCYSETLEFELIDGGSK